MLSYLNVSLTRSGPPVLTRPYMCVIAKLSLESFLSKIADVASQKGVAIKNNKLASISSYVTVLISESPIRILAPEINPPSLQTGT